MENTNSSWFPRKTRNRWAWGFAWGNLAVLLLWNLLPYYEYQNFTKNESSGVWVAEHLVMMEIWPSVFEGLYLLVGRSMDFEDYLNIIASMALIFMVAVQFLLVPMWRAFSSSRLLRFIPAGICAMGFLAVSYWLFDTTTLADESERFSLFLLLLIALNFFLSVVVLVLYHPESFFEHET